MFFLRIKTCLNTFLALLLAVSVGLCAWGMRATRLSSLKGERTFYLDSPSSQANIKSTLCLLDIARVRGESVCLEKGEAEEILAALNAEVLFVEEAGEVRSYYCYSKALYGGLRVGKFWVNLHIAVGEERCVVGSPIIFGGF